MKLKKILSRIIPGKLRRKIYIEYGWKFRFLYGFRDKTSVVFKPIILGNLRNIQLFEYTRIQRGAKVISNKGKFVVKKYSACGAGLTISTTNHTPTVGIPQFFLGIKNINDNEKDIIIEEDVWCGTNVTLLNGAHLGRGCIVGACSLVNKDIPPYAVVVGNPCRIVKYKYNINQIIEHEKILYDEKDRFSIEYLEEVFEKYYKDLKQMRNYEYPGEEIFNLFDYIK